MIAPTLLTRRLILRRLSLDDWEAYATAWADPRMTTFIGGQPRNRNESWGKFLQGIGLWSLFGYGYWSFVARRTGAFMGSGGLARFERGIPELAGYPEAGWALVPEAWGQGLATEALGAILGWADETLARPEIRCVIDASNIASQRVAAKLGFELMGEVEFPPGTTAFSTVMIGKDFAEQAAYLTPQPFPEQLMEMLNFCLTIVRKDNFL